VVTVAGSSRQVLTDYMREAHLNLKVVPSISCKPELDYAYKSTVQPTTYLIDSTGIIVQTDRQGIAFLLNRDRRVENLRNAARELGIA
jgi:hypothetical protein